MQDSVQNARGSIRTCKRAMEYGDVNPDELLKRTILLSFFTVGHQFSIISESISGVR